MRDGSRRASGKADSSQATNSSWYTTQSPGVGRVGEAAALRRPRLEEAHVEVVRGLVDVAARGLVGGHVAGHGHGDDHRGARGQGARRPAVAPPRRARRRRPGSRRSGGGSRRPRSRRSSPSCRPSSGCRPAARALGQREPACPVGLVPPVDEGRDGVAGGGRVDREAHAPAGGGGGRRGRGRGRGAADPPPPQAASRARRVAESPRGVLRRTARPYRPACSSREMLMGLSPPPPSAPRGECRGAPARP